MGAHFQGRQGNVMSKPPPAIERLRPTTKVCARSLCVCVLFERHFHRTVGRITPAKVRPTPKAQPNACLKNWLRVSPRSHPTPHRPAHARPQIVRDLRQNGTRLSPSYASHPHLLPLLPRPPPSNLARTPGFGGGGTEAPMARASASISASFLG